MTDGGGGGDLALDGGLTAVQRREAVLDTARRYLATLAADDISRLPAEELRVMLGKCRSLLEALVEASGPGEPLARTVDEAAAALGVSPLTVYRLVNTGDLAAYRISRRLIRIDEAALRSYLAGHAVGEGSIAGCDIAEQHIRPAWQ
jgi:excisionase family DNA binding protein